MISLKSSIKDDYNERSRLSGILSSGGIGFQGCHQRERVGHVWEAKNMTSDSE